MTHPAPLSPSLLHDARSRPAWRVLLAVLIILVGWFAFGRPPALPEMQGGDKLNHLLAFTTLGVVASFCHAPGWRSTLVAAGGLLLYGAFIEAVQAQLPHRQAEWADLGADALGVACGLLLAAVLRRATAAGATDIRD